jgi:Leucine-rich repeat (LRR) protein
MPLEQLHMISTGVTDLSPLTGMPLKILDVSFDPVEDFKPLIGMPLEICLLQGDRVGDLGFLKGAPLKQLALMGAINPRNLAVLLEIRTLEVLTLPDDFSGISVEDFSAVEKLRDHPSLKQIAAIIPINMQLPNVQSKDDFWKNWDRDFAWQLRLRRAGLHCRFGREDLHSWWLDCNGQPIGDLSILAGAAIGRLSLNGAKITNVAPLQSLPLTSLELDGTPVADLTPLRGQKLTYLGLVGTSVHDLSPVRGMPLTRIDLRDSRITDVSPVADVPTLEDVSLPLHATNVEALRRLPNLKRLSFTYHYAGGTTCSAEDFWKTWDGLPWARKLEAAGINYSFGQSQDGYYDVDVHDPKFADCSIFTGSNVRSLSLQRIGVVDLSPLAVLPLVYLQVNETHVKDLSVLRSPVLSNSLRILRVADSYSITDFSPIAACTNLESLDLYHTALADLSILKGMKLHDLVVGGTAVSDIAALAGMPLEGIYLASTKVTDVSPLLKCPTLKRIILPSDAEDITSLRALPHLERIDYSGSGTNADLTADQFWAKHGGEAWLDALRSAGFKPTTTQLRDGTWDVNIGNSTIRDLTPLKGVSITRLSLGHTAVTDLEPLRGMKLKRLALNETSVANLEPLRGMPLEELYLSNTKVADISPLRGMPLKILSLRNCTKITDFSPLADCRSLTSLTLPSTAKDIEFLRSFPSLENLTYKTAPQIPKDFWADYDKAKSAPTSQPATPATRPNP